MKPRVSIIASIGTQQELGKKGELIWRIKEDLGRVKSLTMGHPLIMGRKTYESIGRPLPGRTTIVVTNTEMHIEGCEVFPDFESALAYAHSIETEEIFVFGGAQIYALALPQVDRLYLTQVDAKDADADAFFPLYETEFTKVLEDERYTSNELSYRWVTLERK